MNLFLNAAIETKQAVLDSFGVASCLAEQQGNQIVLVAMNDLYRDIYGFSRETRRLPVDAKSLSLASGRPPDEVEAIANKIHTNITRCIANKKTTLAENTISQIDGSEKWSRNTLAPIIEDDEVKFVLASLVDITETILAQREIEANLKKLLGQHVRVCRACANVENSNGEWQSLNEFMANSKDMNFSHGICPTCEASVRSRFKRR